MTSATRVTMTERDLTRAVIDFAKQQHFLVYHTFLSKWSEAGFPDLCLVRERVIWVELKSERGKLSERQMEWLETLKAAGAETYVWRPEDWPDAVAKTLLRDTRRG